MGFRHRAWGRNGYIRPFSAASRSRSGSHPGSGGVCGHDQRPEGCRRAPHPCLAAGGLAWAATLAASGQIPPSGSWVGLVVARPQQLGRDRIALRTARAPPVHTVGQQVGVPLLLEGRQGATPSSEGWRRAGLPEPHGRTPLRGARDAEAVGLVQTGTRSVAVCPPAPARRSAPCASATGDCCPPNGCGRPAIEVDHVNGDPPRTSAASPNAVTDTEPPKIRPGARDAESGEW